MHCNAKQPHVTEAKQVSLKRTPVAEADEVSLKLLQKRKPVSLKGASVTGAPSNIAGSQR